MHVIGTSSARSQTAHKTPCASAGSAGLAQGIALAYGCYYGTQISWACTGQVQLTWGLEKDRRKMGGKQNEMGEDGETAAL